MTEQIGFLFNADRCVGCKSCEMACKNENSTPLNVNWRRVSSLKAGKNISISCNHCESPECFRVCTRRAYVKRRDGIVMIDVNRCDGCMDCVSACPYNAPQFDIEKNKASKCTFCLPRREVGLLPACVNACHTGALSTINMEQYPKDTVATIEGFPNIRLTKPSIRFYPVKEKLKYWIKT
ncbi:4Fe-4S dicluster domain-containing protein [Desulfosporosinus meridiei]|uniref:Fe-S-cluster-containing hydrogenase subunit n=1 Tax=Desulfosporosinus meridiei (strain ATCC BAA-275 / DSM 13257 / KCTC 12902 / NCIMB 13706 / S10) TaxID=768704 RepID=J7IPB8_DESMD|nr:4Fe-4S dicluster domain-containing protein [Desulfosporosinus meridiei]AFQ43450.1 Fe-S-cluster-containing hydrogenase subunit [Desulfosporosinus meridiei DSM 13257]